MSDANMDVRELSIDEIGMIAGADGGEVQVKCDTTGKCEIVVTIPL